MVILSAFIETESYVQWIDIWCGDTLRQLDSETFNFFKSFYGVNNLCLACSFDRYDYYFDEPFED